MLQRGTTIVIQYVHAHGARRSIRRRDDDGLYQIWEDNVLDGLGEEYDDRPVAGLFGTLGEAQTEFLRSNHGFKAE
jgi:hypothetical protein